MNNLKVSVIIPVHNTAEYLGACLNSIINQTLHDIEIICVDDGSQDGSLEILRQYEKKDNRIFTYAQENHGQSSARNKGIAKAQGKYLYFMDSDDILDMSALEILYNKAEEDKLDVLYFDGDSFTNELAYEKLVDHYTKYYARNAEYKGIYSGRELLSKMVQNNEYRVSPCLQFINRNYFVKNNINFFEGIIHEDNLFNYECMLLADKVVHIPLKLFHRRIRSKSTMTKKTSFDNAYGYFICHLKMNQFYNENNLESTCDDMVFLPIKQMLDNSRNHYQQLFLEEKQKFLKLSYSQRQLFHLYIIELCNEKEKVKEEQKKIKNIEKKLNASLLRENSLKQSVSFRLGRVITWLPRKFREVMHIF